MESIEALKDFDEVKDRAGAWRPWQLEQFEFFQGVALSTPACRHFFQGYLLVSIHAGVSDNQYRNTRTSDQGGEGIFRVFEPEETWICQPHSSTFQGLTIDPDRLWDINVKGTFFTIQQALPLLPDGSSILMTSSVATHQAWPGFSFYSATKAAVRSLARSLSAELLARNIRANVITAGNIDTPMIERYTTTQEDLVGLKQLLASRTPMGRIGKPEEVARAALFLASDESSFTTGQELYVDGGAIELGSTQLR